MQADRLFGITYLLLDRRQVTAQELAERFEVSRRTIYRDIETLSLAGVPLYASKGRGGGIRLMEQFVLQKSLLTEREQVDLLAALEGLQAARYPDAQAIREKLSGLFQRGSTNWIEVDFSDWSGNEREAFALLKAAILQRRTVVFEYRNNQGEHSEREAEPLRLYFRHRAWYLAAFCCVRQQPRLFKLSRMRAMRLTERVFTREMEETALFVGAVDPPKEGEEIVLRIDAANAYRAYDEFPPEWVERQADGDVVVRMRLMEDAWLYSYLLSFGAHARVLEPPRIRDALIALCEKILVLYKS